MKTRTCRERQKKSVSARTLELFEKDARGKGAVIAGASYRAEPYYQDLRPGATQVKYSNLLFVVDC